MYVRTVYLRENGCMQVQAKSERKAGKWGRSGSFIFRNAGSLSTLFTALSLHSHSSPVR